ncbi:MAG: flagellar FlbD family protein [Blastococcus sp.]|nr:flagellar FlbD family protein [Blastococcus sp.]
MIAVTCRNGEHFTIDPAAIERAEAVPDTVLHMVGGRTYVLSMSLDELLRAIRDSYAELIVAQRRMGVATAELTDSAAGVRAAADLRVERRAHLRDGDTPGSPADRRPSDEQPTPDA